MNWMFCVVGLDRRHTAVVADRPPPAPQEVAVGRPAWGDRWTGRHPWNESGRAAAAAASVAHRGRLGTNVARRAGPPEDARRRPGCRRAVSSSRHSSAGSAGGAVRINHYCHQRPGIARMCEEANRACARIQIGIVLATIMSSVTRDKITHHGSSDTTTFVPSYPGPLSPVQYSGYLPRCSVSAELFSVRSGAARRGGRCSTPLLLSPLFSVAFLSSLFGSLRFPRAPAGCSGACAAGGASSQKF